MHAVTVRSVTTALALVGVAACSGDDIGSDSTVATTTSAPIPTTAAPTTAPTTVPETTPATTAPPTSPPTTERATTVPASSAPEPIDEAAYVELAESALLDLDVFPDGWEERPASDDDDAGNERFGDRVAECLGTDDERVSELLEPREANSPEFAGPGDSSPTVEHQVMVADDEAMAVKAMEDVAAIGADACLEQTMQEFFDEEAAADIEQDGVTIGDIAVERIEVEAPADLVVGYLVELPVQAGDGQTASGYLQVFYLRRGRALSQLRLSSFGTIFDPEGVRLLTGEVITRLDRIAE